MVWQAPSERLSLRLWMWRKRFYRLGGVRRMKRLGGLEGWAMRLGLFGRGMALEGLGGGWHLGFWLLCLVTRFVGCLMSFSVSGFFFFGFVGFVCWLWSWTEAAIREWGFFFYFLIYSHILERELLLHFIYITHHRVFASHLFQPIHPLTHLIMQSCIRGYDLMLGAFLTRILSEVLLDRTSITLFIDSILWEVKTKNKRSYSLC